MESRWVEVPKMAEWAIKKQRLMCEYNGNYSNGNNKGSKDEDKSRIVRIIWLYFIFTQKININYIKIN